jgi:Ni/Fe-hydrogenase 1 B-type cytochrome subunit
MDKNKTPRMYHGKTIYVWQSPVRIYHWVNAVSILTLCITGYLIGSPLAIQSQAEASFSYWFGTVRFIHFVSAFVFFFNFIFRTYWGFVGNDYSRWYHFIPYTKKHWKEIVQVLKVDILQIGGKPIESIGHNNLAGFTYFITALAFLVQCLTGFGLYSDMSTSWWPALFSWVPSVLGGDFLTRNIHHIFMWLFIIFAMFHIYLVFYHDYIERRGIASSMIGGWKFIEEEAHVE